MAWKKLPIQDQWQNASDVNASGYVFKTYIYGTTTPTPMAIDSAGATTVSTVTLNADGIPEVSGNEVTLYIDRDFRFAIYENASDAASNTNAFYGPVDIDNLFDGVFEAFTSYSDMINNADVASYSGGEVVVITGTGGDSGIGFIRVSVAHGITATSGRQVKLSNDVYWERDDFIYKYLPDVVANGDYYTDSGSADAYTLTAISPNENPTAYRNGMRFRFIGANTNTGGAATVNIATLGSKSLVIAGGGNPPANSVSTSYPNECYYDSGNDYCVISGEFTETTINISTDADLTLTAAQNEYPRITVTDTGAVLTANRNVIVDTDQRSFIFFNETAYTLTVKTSAGTGVAVISNASVALYCDGTNVVFDYVVGKELPLAPVSLSGTAVDFTSIPSWVTEIEIVFTSASTNGTNVWLVQIGTAGTPQTTGYGSSSGQSTATGINTTGSANGFIISCTNSALQLSGSLKIKRKTTNPNVWTASFSIGVNSSVAYFGGGTVTLSGTLDIVRLTTSGGTNSFDNGEAQLFLR